MTDIIVIAILVLLVVGVSFYMWKRKKAGKSSCGGSCDGCSGDCG